MSQLVWDQQVVSPAGSSQCCPSDHRLLFNLAVVGGYDMIKHHPNAMKYLAKLVEEGKYKLPVKVQVVGKGFQAIEGNLDSVMTVSGTKLVVTM